MAIHYIEDISGIDSNYHYMKMLQDNAAGMNQNVLDKFQFTVRPVTHFSNGLLKIAFFDKEGRLLTTRTIDSGETPAITTRAYEIDGTGFVSVYKIEKADSNGKWFVSCDHYENKTGSLWNSGATGAMYSSSRDAAKRMIDAFVSNEWLPM